MPPYGNEPDWATPGATTTQTGAPLEPADATGGAAINGTGSENSGAGKRTRCVLVLLSCLNCGLAAMMVALAILTILDFASKNVSLKNVAFKPFLAAYMILFALLLFCYELMWWAPVPAINRTLRKNFGFMYGLKGKGVYMIFVAFLCLGLKDESNHTIKILNWATGIAFLFVGVLHFFLICSNPEFLDTYKAPTAGLDRYPGNTSDGPGEENVV